MDTTRVESIQRIAGQLDMQYSESDNWGVLPLLKDFYLFRKGTSKRISNVLRKEDPLHESDIRIFDYQYTIQANNARVTHKQTVFFVHSKHLVLPQFLMAPENFFHKIGSLLGLQKDIDFEEHPDFSNNYFLQGEDEDFIRASLGDNVLHFFSIEKEWNLEGIGFFIILYKKGGFLEVGSIKKFYEIGIKVYHDLMMDGPDWELDK